MRRSKTDEIGSIIQQFVESNRLSGGLNEIRIINGWEEVVGRTIARQTQEIYIKEGSLFVKINSPIIKKELSYLKEKLVARLNELAGEKVIHSIKIL